MRKSSNNRSNTVKRPKKDPATPKYIDVPADEYRAHYAELEASLIRSRAALTQAEIDFAAMPVPNNYKLQLEY